MFWWFLSRGDFSSCCKLILFSEATLHIFWFHHIMMFILCDNNARKKCLLAWGMKGQLSPRIKAHNHPFLGEKKALIEIFFKRTAESEYSTWSWVLPCYLSSVSKLKHPYFANILEYKLFLPWFPAGINHITHITTKTKNQAERFYQWCEI